ncbi:GDSL family lipase [Achromobacter aloeverae]|uniref:GDSL family lipase n=2 Tax=Achromobacter aloeverae TaxID=1750518 RepID=A0A4Q1HCM9_9BURK|nr:GDSL family lipase [Achromobacter aloeverae]
MRCLIGVFPACRRLFVALSACVLGVTLAALPAPACAQAAQGWQASWTTALQAIPRVAVTPPLYQPPPVADRSVRQIIVPTLSGSEARIRLSNRHGTRPLVITGASIARSAVGAGIVPGTERAVTFGASRTVVLQPGMEMDSDAIPFAIARGVPVAISLASGAGNVMQAWHRIAGRVNYVSSEGNHVGDVSGAAFSIRYTQYAWVTGLAVTSRHANAVVAIGDSITDGLRSTFGANRSWPSVLATRLAAEGATPRGILNAGISGNRLLSDSPCYGDSLASRLEHDALALPGVHTVVVLVGINDINFATMPARQGLDCDYPHRHVSAADLIAGYRRVIAAAHRHGLRVLGGTLTPASLPPDREAVRLQVNRWIREGGGYDGVIDFDKALRDPGRPDRLQATYDSGDHVHPSDAGYAAMARAVPLSLLD